MGLLSGIGFGSQPRTLQSQMGRVVEKQFYQTQTMPTKIKLVGNINIHEYLFPFAYCGTTLLLSALTSIPSIRAFSTPRHKKHQITSRVFFGGTTIDRMKYDKKQQPWSVNVGRLVNGHHKIKSLPASTPSYGQFNRLQRETPISKVYNCQITEQFVVPYSNNNNNKKKG